jgi:hypothetical protein
MKILPPDHVRPDRWFQAPNRIRAVVGQDLTFAIRGVATSAVAAPEGQMSLALQVPSSRHWAWADLMRRARSISTFSPVRDAAGACA